MGQGSHRTGTGRPGHQPDQLPRSTPEEAYAFVALGSELDGAFAQYCLAEASELFDVSDSTLDDVEITTLSYAHGTAWNLLDRAGVKAGQSVLVTGASGGVGMAAVQLASHLGTEVTGLSCPRQAHPGQFVLIPPGNVR